MAEENEKVTSSKKRMKQGKFLAITLPIMAVGIAAMIAFPVVMNAYKTTMDNALSKGTQHITNVEGTENWDADYYGKKDHSDMTKERDEACKVAEKVADEGVVLLKNDGVLPIGNTTKVTALGRNIVDPIYGGSGSGNVNTDLDYIVTPVKALKASFGDRLNKTVIEKLEELNPKQNYTRSSIVMDNPGASHYEIGEIPVNDYTNDVWSSVDKQSVALVMISRPGGEGGDLTKDMSKSGGTAAEHQLQLDSNEKALIEKAKATCSKVVILLNMSTTMELGSLAEDAGINAIVWVGSPGAVGFSAMGDVLTGKVNPSGRTVDTYAADFTKDPTWSNFGDVKYTNVGEDKYSDTGKSQTEWKSKYVEYEEGIYVGYRYYETAYKEKGDSFYNAWKSSETKDEGTGVVYPFGYGLSYTTFTQSIKSHKVNDGKVEVEVEVKNTGSVAGKDVVQLYYTAPYTKGGVEKAYVNLAAFDKTPVIESNKSETLTLSFDVEDMASYDYKTEKAYVLDQGDYEIKLMKNAHEEYEGQKFTYKVNSKEVYNSSNPRNSEKDAQTLLKADGSYDTVLQKSLSDSDAKVVAATNRFDDVSSYVDNNMTSLSRSDFDATKPTPMADKAAPADVVNALAKFNVETDPILGNVKTSKVYKKDAPTSGATNGLSLIDLRTKDYYDPVWNQYLDQLKLDNNEYENLVNETYCTHELTDMNKPVTADYDGPQGWSSFMDPDVVNNAVAWTSEVMVATTWNTKLAEEMGEAQANDALALTTRFKVHISGWYGPAMNCHRSPFAGRNFEYYSEDPLISGQMGLGEVNGAAKKGVYSYIKHFAINDQETNRLGVQVWANEQAIREIYLKPFETVVKDSRMEVKYISDDKGTLSTKVMRGATAVMTSLNKIGATPASHSYALLTEILRDEWGFTGMVNSDMNAGYDSNAMLRAGNDLRMGFNLSGASDKESATSKWALRNAMKNMLYTVTNSNAMTNMKPGAIVTYDLAGWQIGLIIGEVAAGVLELGAVAWIALRFVEKKNHPDWYAD